MEVMIWKCSFCGYMHKDSEAPEVCPKCGNLKEKYAAMSEEDVKKVLDSDRTNDIHMELVRLAMKIRKLTNEGITINLDAPCVALFKKAHDEAWVIKQRSKAEIASHVGKGKW
jgi:predicted  nucleic acid-binding Zn-ribbon protein